jgi:hypothetical protein
VIASHLVLNRDLLRGLLLGLGNGHAEDSVLEAGLDGLLVDADGEAERAVERSNRALRDPVLRLVVRLLGDSLLLGLRRDLRIGAVGFGRLLGGLVLDGGLVRLIAFDGLGWTCAFFAHSFVLARDRQCVRIRPLDVDVLLLDTRELAVQLIAVFVLLHIELR